MDVCIVWLTLAIHVDNDLPSLKSSLSAHGFYVIHIVMFS